MTPLEKPRAFQNALIRWFDANAKDYPWRQTTDPYAILVSEIMLQQTQVATVLNKGFYTNFLKKFPTPKELAAASEQEILSAWEGLGYYRRVRNLQKTAIAICEEHGGVFPTDHAEILALPGVGPYTAGAVASFAYNQSQPIVDANVARLFSRLFNYQERVDSTAGLKQLWAWAAELVPTKNARSYNSALMEIGQQICINKAPKCNECFLKKYCTAENPAELPIKKAAKKTVLIDEHCIFAIDSKKGILLQQESDSNRRAGMWKLPLRDHLSVENLPLLSKSSYAITHHKVTLRIYSAANKTLPKNTSSHTEQWHPLDTLTDLPMPSPFRKALNILLEDYV